MRLLLDSHTLIWAVDAPDRLGARAAAELRNTGNELLLGAGTLWEIGIKVGQGKLKLSLPFREWMTKAIADLKLAVLPITLDVADVQSGLPRHHGDPFDRMLVAFTRTERVPVVSNDEQLDPYGVTRIW